MAEVTGTASPDREATVVLGARAGDPMVVATTSVGQVHVGAATPAVTAVLSGRPESAVAGRASAVGNSVVTAKAAEVRAPTGMRRPAEVIRIVGPARTATTDLAMAAGVPSTATRVVVTGVFPAPASRAAVCAKTGVPSTSAFPSRRYRLTLKHRIWRRRRGVSCVD